MLSFVTRSIQRGLGIIGVRLARVEPCIEPVKPFDVLELAIAAALRRRDDFYFVQVGANDGILYDLLNPLIRRYGLAGCLVEPMPDVFEQLKKNYADQPLLDFRNILIGDRDGTAELHRFARDAPVPQDFYHGLARQDGDYIRKRAGDNGLGAHVETLVCPMQTFATFAATLPVALIDLLYIDTEGSDDIVIRSAFDAGIFPAIIQYEWSEMSPRRRCDLKILLVDHGYKFVDAGPDTICMRDEESPTP